MIFSSKMEEILKLWKDLREYKKLLAQEDYVNISKGDILYTNLNNFREYTLYGFIKLIAIR